MGLERRERRKVDDEQGHRRRRHRCECLGADPPGTLAARGTGLKPAMDLLDILMTAAGVQGDCGGLGWASAISPHRSGSDRSILFRGEPPTGKPEAGNPPVRFGGRGDGQPLLPIPIYKKVVRASLSTSSFTWCLGPGHLGQ